MKSLIRTTAVALSMIFVVSLSQCGGGPQQSAPSLAITTASLPNGTSEVAYSQTIQASGGVGPFAWAVGAGALPHILGQKLEIRARKGYFARSASSLTVDSPTVGLAA